MKMKLTHQWRGLPPGTIVDATPGQQIMITTLGYGIPVDKAVIIQPNPSDTPDPSDRQPEPLKPKKGKAAN